MFAIIMHENIKYIKVPTHIDLQHYKMLTGTRKYTREKSEKLESRSGKDEGF